MAKIKAPKPSKKPKIDLSGRRFSPATFGTPHAIFFEYILACFVAVVGFRMIFPTASAPLPIYLPAWGFTGGVLEFIDYFPALVMSALVIPFGLKDQEEEVSARYSLDFLDKLKSPILVAIAATALYGVLFFLCLPVTEEVRVTMSFRGELYKKSTQKALEHIREKEWTEAARFLTVCERIWPDSPEMVKPKEQIEIELDQYRFLRNGGRTDTPEELVDPHNRNPVDVTEALRFAAGAMTEERYFDAHWLATLAGRLAKPGSPEVGEAAHLASLAWNAIESLSPNNRETELYRRFRLKQSGYQAMIGKDWIQGYYIFKELSDILRNDPAAPADPDVEKFRTECEQETLRIAFFADELDLTLGESLTEAVFSLPRLDDSGPAGGRLVLRADALSTFQDYSYGFDVELLAVSADGTLYNRCTAPYAKFLPKTFNGKQRVVLLLQALDRDDRNLRWGPEWSGSGGNGLEEAEVPLDLSYDDFLLITKIRRGINGFQIPELFVAERRLAPYGYIPEVFRAEAINRVAEPVFLLPILILTLIIGWRFRALKHPRYLGIPMLVILPIVFDALINLYRALMDDLGIWMALFLSFNSAIAVTLISALVLFFLTLIILASQRE